MDKNLYCDLEVADMKIRYDAYAKAILSYRIILAHILVGVVPEYEGMDPEEVARLIEAPALSAAPVGTGEQARSFGIPADAVPPLVKGENTESRIPGEGVITLDILISALAPEQTAGSYRKTLVDVEAQNCGFTGYWIEARAVFYCSRVISSQQGREFTDSHYEQILTVNSVWILTDPPAAARNTVTRYTFQPENLYGEYGDRKRCDLMRVILIGLPKELPEPEESTPLIRLLTTIFSLKLSFTEKRDILTEEFGIRMDPETEGRMQEMCNWSEAIERDALERGEKIGMERGKEIGMELNRLENARELLDVLSPEIIAQKLKLSLETVLGLRAGTDH